MAYREYGITDSGEMIRANGMQETDEERRKKLAAIAGMITGTGPNLFDVAGQGITNKVNQALGQPVVPEQPRTQQVAQPAIPQANVPEPQQTMPNANVPAPNIGQLPQPGPGIQVAGPTQMAPAATSVETAKQLTQTNPSIGANAKPGVGTDLNDVYHESVIAARNEQDPIKRRQAYAALLSNESVPEGYKTMAQRFIAEDYQKARLQQQAEDKISQATPNDLARYMQSKSEDGSYIKAILYTKLGLTELAKEEQQKLGAGSKTGSAVDATTGQRYTVERNANGEITRAFNTEGKKAGPEEIARLSAATLPTQAHQLPAVHGTPVQKTITDANGQQQTVTGLIMYDPQSQSSYVQVGNQRLPTTGWTTMSQTPSSIFEAEKARQGGTGAGKGFDVTGPGAAGSASNIATQLGAKVISGDRSTEKQASLYQQSVDAGTPGVLPNGNRVAKPGTSKHETGNAVDIDPSSMTPELRRKLAINGFRQPMPKDDPNHWEYDPSTANKKSPLYVQEAKAAGIKKEEEAIGEARGKEGAKIVAQQGFADNAHPVLEQIEGIIKRSTGSGIGAKADQLANLIGKSPKGDQAIAELKPLAGALTRMIPRFEGSQSDADVREYKENAGNFADPTLPIEKRLSALQGMVRLLKIYDREKRNDWSTFGAGEQGTTSNSGTTPSGNKYKFK